MFLNKIKSTDIGAINNSTIEIGENKAHLIIVGENGTGKSLLLSNIYNHICLVTNKEDSIDGVKYPLEHDSSYIVRKTPASSGIVPRGVIWGSFDTFFSDNINASTIIGDQKLKDQYGKKHHHQINNENYNHDVISLYITANRNTKTPWLGSFRKNRENKEPRDICDLESFLNTLSLEHMTGKIEYANSYIELATDILNIILGDVKGTNVWSLSDYHNINNAHDSKEDPAIKLPLFGIMRANKGSFLLDELSSGEQSLILIFLNIVKELSSFEKSTGKRASHGIVVIDEIDLHLHVSAQITCAKLFKFFPNIQFIVSTHSPVFLASLNEKSFSDDSYLTRYIKLPDCKVIDNNLSKEFSEFKAVRNNIHINESALKLLTDIKSIKTAIIVEGITDEKIIRRAIDANGVNQPEVIKNSGGAEILRAFILESIKLNSKTSLVCIFDFDEAYNYWKSIKKSHCLRMVTEYSFMASDNILIMLLHPPIYRKNYADHILKERSLLNIELMFENDVIKSLKSLKKLRHPGTDESVFIFSGKKQKFADAVIQKEDSIFYGFKNTLKVASNFFKKS